MQEFLATLQDENTVLATPAVGDALDATTARKNDYAQALTQAATDRTALLAAMGFHGNPNELGVVAQSHPELRSAVDQLVNLAQQAKTLNQENGIIIEAYQRHSQEALATLQSLVGARENRLYDASGRTKAARPQNTSSPTARIKAG